MGKYYSLLTAVGKYNQENIEDLPSCEMDLKLMKRALTEGLKLPADTIRTIGEDGYTSTRSFAQTLSEFASLLGEEDGFIYYFSGHGSNGNLCFSDGILSIQSVVDFMEKLKAKNKILILDCCYSGRFCVSGVKQMNLEETISAFAGAGTVVLASSASDETSWLGPGKNHSLYTGMLTTAMTINRKIRQGKISLADINEEVVNIANAWNQKNPQKMQHPIYRARIGGTIYFDVENYNPYETLQVYLETENYTIKNVEPLSSLQEKRLAVFVVVPDKCTEKELAVMTKKIAGYVKYANVFSTKASEIRFRNRPVKAIWYYFGHDESDMVNHRYFARSIWCCDRNTRKKYFTPQKNATTVRGIWIAIDPLYDFVRRLQKSDLTREEFKNRVQKLLTKTVSMAEQYIADIREIDNRTKNILDIRKTYAGWIKEIYEEYYKITELPVPPDDLHEWFKTVEDLAGTVLDMAILLKKDEEYSGGNRWMVQNCIRRYYESLERLRKLESS